MVTSYASVQILNAERLNQSCERLVMPTLPEGRFLEAVKEVVKANKDFVPPYGHGASLYIRPYMMGTNSVIGVKPADEYQFRVFTTPVGPYFKGGAKPIKIRITDFDRAAPHGTGHIKAGLNYAMSLYAITDAHNKGYAENMYLDAATRTHVEETGGANFIFITKDGKLVTPKETFSALAVGGAVGHNPISIIVPCHRVIGSNGKLTGYAGGIERKKYMLDLEAKHK